MDRLEYLDRFIAEIDNSKNLEDIFCVLKIHLEHLGFPFFTYWLIAPENGPRQPLFISSYPKEWIERYIKKNYASTDLIPSEAVRTMRPFLWSSLTHHPYITAPQRLIFSEGSEFKINSGASVPIHGPGKAKGKLSVANDMCEEEFDKLFLYRRHEIHLIANYVHEKILSFGLEAPLDTDLNLSPRELEILTWTAQGKTRWEISEILKISEDTVKNHIDHCCRKLKVSNKTHAVAVALTHALIWP